MLFMFLTLCRVFSFVTLYCIKGIYCAMFSKFVQKNEEGDSSCQTTEPVSIGSLYSVGVAACVLPKSRYTLTPLIPQTKSSNGDLISALYCTMAKSQEHMPFPTFLWA